MPTDEKPPAELSAPDPYAKLHHKQIRFIHEYLIDRNATAAYMRSGYTATRASAGRNAHVLLKNPEVSAALKAAEQEILERVKLRQYEAHCELRAVATSDLTHYVVGDDGNVSLTADAPQSATKALQSVHRRSSTRKTKDGDTITTQDVKITLWNKLEAIKIVGQADGWIKPDKVAEPDQDQANNNYFLTLIQIIQKQGITSKVGAEDFREQPEIDITPERNGHTNGKSNGDHS